jgi:hypothetical protein
VYTALTSKTGNKNRELPEKWDLRPRARFPIACMASTATAMFTSVISCRQKHSEALLIGGQNEMIIQMVVKWITDMSRIRKASY